MQIPVLIEEKEGRLFICGHIAKKSDHHKAFEENPNVLALFTGAHSYVSGTWYAGNPHQASTWNYIDVQARGKIKFYDTERTKQIIHNLTDQHESADSEAAFNKLPIEYVDRLVKAIIGFTIEISSIENVFKLSQNRDELSYQHIIDHLRDLDPGAQKIAEIMEKKIKE